MSFYFLLRERSNLTHVNSRPLGNCYTTWWMSQLKYQKDLICTQTFFLGGVSGEKLSNPPSDTVPFLPTEIYPRKFGKKKKKEKKKKKKITSILTTFVRKLYLMLTTPKMGQFLWGGVLLTFLIFFWIFWIFRDKSQWKWLGQTGPENFQSPVKNLDKKTCSPFDYKIWLWWITSS